MNIQELQKQIIDNKLDNLYVFVGEEIAIQKIYINKMAQIKNLEIQYVEEYRKIHNSLVVNNLFNTKKLYVILDDLDMLKQEDVWKDINVNGNIIIFKYNNLDKRNKFYKQFENNIVEFNKLSDEVLIKYIQKELKYGENLSKDNCKKLIDICGGNYNQILLEIDKMKHYYDYWINGGARPDNNIVFNVLNEQGAFHKEVSDIIFIFVDKVVTRDVKNTYRLYEQLKQMGESNIKLLSLLYNSIKTILLIQSCMSADVCKTTGLSNGQVYYNRTRTDYYTTGELVNALRLIQRTEENIKTGKLDEQYSIDYVLINIL